MSDWIDELDRLHKTAKDGSAPDYFHFNHLIHEEAWPRIREELKQLRELRKVLDDHIADLRRIAKAIEGWQDPMIGTLDGAIAEIRKAADDLRALLDKVEDDDE